MSNNEKQNQRDLLDAFLRAAAQFAQTEQKLLQQKELDSRDVEKEYFAHQKELASQKQMISSYLEHAKQKLILHKLNFDGNIQSHNNTQPSETPLAELGKIVEQFTTSEKIFSKHIDNLIALRERNRDKRITAVIIFIIITVFLIAASLIGYYNFRAGIIYSSAMNYLDSEDYSNAQIKFEELRQFDDSIPLFDYYKDSEELLVKSYLLGAKQSLEVGDCDQVTLQANKVYSLDSTNEAVGNILLECYFRGSASSNLLQSVTSIIKARWGENSDLGSIILRNHMFPIVGLSFSADGSLLASADKSEIIVYDVYTGEILSSKETGNTKGIALSPSGDVLVESFFAEGPGIRFLDVKNNMKVISDDISGDTMGFSSDGKILITARFLDCSCSVWRVSGTSIKKGDSVVTNSTFCSQFASSSNGRYVAFGNKFGDIEVWNIDAGHKLLVKFKQIDENHEGSAYKGKLRFTTDGKYLISSGFPYIRIWSFPSGTLEKELITEGEVVDFEITADNQSIVAIGDFPNVVLWDTVSNTDIGAIFNYKSEASAIAISSLGNVIAIAGPNNTIHLKVVNK